MTTSEGVLVKAGRWFGRRDVRVEMVQRPTCAAHEALVRVLWCGLCGSDLEEYLEGPVVIPSALEPTTGRIRPLTLGHEFVGVVECAAEDGTGPPAGTMVVPDVVSGCGTCWWCRHHDEGLCPDLTVLGLHIDGGLAEFVSARADRLVTVPSHLPASVACLAEPLAVAVRAARAAGGLAGKGVLVIGGGSVGQLMARVARGNGAYPVAVVDPSSLRRELAVTSGADVALRPEDVTVAPKHFPQRGIDVVFEASGAKGQPGVAVSLARRGGVVVLLGVSARAESLDLLDIVLHEKTMRGSAAHMYDDDVQVAVDLLASATVTADGIVTHCIDLDHVVEQGFDRLAAAEDGTIKILVRCSVSTPDGTEGLNS